MKVHVKNLCFSRSNVWWSITRRFWCCCWRGLTLTTATWHMSRSTRLWMFPASYRYQRYIEYTLSYQKTFHFFIPGPNFSHCDQNQTYELYAVVNHSGDLSSGCYSATIWDDENWFTFTDSRVTLVRLNTLTPRLLKVTVPLCYSYVLHWETFYVSCCVFSFINRLITSHSRRITLRSKF